MILDRRTGGEEKGGASAPPLDKFFCFLFFLSLIPYFLFLLFGDVDDVAVVEFVGDAYAAAFVGVVGVGVGGGCVAVYLLAFFGDYLHVFFAGIPRGC